MTNLNKQETETLIAGLKEHREALIRAADSYGYHVGDFDDASLSSLLDESALNEDVAAIDEAITRLESEHQLGDA